MPADEWITVAVGSTSEEARGELLGWLALNGLQMPESEDDVRVYHDTVEGFQTQWRILLRAGSATPVREQ